MNPDSQTKISEQEAKLDEILRLSKKTEKYMRITFWATIIVVVLPAVLLAFAIPAFITSYTDTLGALNI